jgi:hypothetical protein
MRMLSKVVSALAVLMAWSLSGWSQEQCPGLLDTGWRGIDCLYCLHPRAPGNSVPYTSVRSSCFQCARGTGRGRPPGVLLEEHDDSFFPSRWDGIINTDGRYFRFSRETSESPTLEELEESWLRRAARQRNAFLL